MAAVGSNDTLAVANISERAKNAIISGSGKCWVTRQRDDSETVMNVRVLYDEYTKNSHNMSFKKTENPQVDLTVSRMT